MRTALGWAALALIAVAVVAHGIGWRVSPTLSQPGLAAQDGSRVEALSSKIERLAKRLDEEVGRRADLEARLAALSTVEESDEPKSPLSVPASTGPGTSPIGFDPAPLVTVGFARRDAEDYAALLDEVELRRLALRDQAAREGWVGSPRFVEADRALVDDLRASRELFGDEFYDWALYSSGQPNRLRVGDVIADSEASSAGLEPGDVLVRYADSLVLGMDEMGQLTSGGSAGEPTPIEVQRGAETLRLFVRRGPLGVRLEPIQRRPAPPRS